VVDDALVLERILQGVDQYARSEIRKRLGEPIKKRVGSASGRDVLEENQLRSGKLSGSMHSLISDVGPQVSFVERGRWW
jgi:hypothetical protein